jgi:hypothetical protein
MQATMRNRYNDKQVRVLIKKTDSGLLYITKRQYLAALAKLGFGPIAVSTPLLVMWGEKQYGAIG